MWDAVRSSDDTPRHLLTMSDEVMKGTVLAARAWKERNDAWAQLDGVAYEDESQQIILAVGYGAAQVLACSLRDEVFGDQPSEDLTDADVDPDELDSSFFAAAVYAQGPVWEASSSAVKRREFWQWWLEQAVRSAEQVAPSDA